MNQTYLTPLILAASIIFIGYAALCVVALRNYMKGKTKKPYIFLAKIGIYFVFILAGVYGFLIVRSHAETFEIDRVKTALVNSNYELVGTTAILSIHDTEGEFELFRHPDGTVWVKKLDTYVKLK